MSTKYVASFITKIISYVLNNLRTMIPDNRRSDIKLHIPVLIRTVSCTYILQPTHKIYISKSAEKVMYFYVSNLVALGLLPSSSKDLCMSEDPVF